MESLKINKGSLLLLEDLIEMFQEFQEAKEKINKLNHNLRRFSSININPNEPRFSINEIYDIIFEQCRDLTNKYLFSIGKELNERIFEENKQNINQIRYISFFKEKFIN